jgi:hypothetical protein
MTMAEVVLHFVTEEGADPDAVAEELKSDLSNSDGIQDAFVEAEQPRLGPAEVLAIIQCVTASIDLLKMAASWVNDHRKHIHSAEIEIDGRRVTIGQLTPDQKTWLEKQLAGTT